MQSPAEVRAERVGGPWHLWVLSRLAALLLGVAAWAMLRGNVFWDTSYYAHWASGTLTGSRVPYRDFGWEYPPAALPAMLIPGLAAVSGFAAHLWEYGALWVALMLAADAAVMRLLVQASAHSGSRVGHPAVTVWTWALPLLGALSWARFDILPAAGATVAVLCAGRGETRRAGSWAGIGLVLKMWPALLAPVQRTRPSAALAGVSALSVLGLTIAITEATTGRTGFDSVLSYQSRRGVQVESLAALPLLWLRHLHAGGYHRRLRFGAWEIVGPHVGLLATSATVLYVMSLVAIACVHWRLMRGDAGRAGVAATAMAVISVTLLTDKVLSPQYLLWMVGIYGAACVLEPDTWRPYLPYLLVACGLTAIEFPWFYGDVLGGDWLGLLALTARDAVLIGIGVSVVRELVRRLRCSPEEKHGLIPVVEDGCSPGAGCPRNGRPSGQTPHTRRASTHWSRFRDVGSTRGRLKRLLQAIVLFRGGC